MLMLKQRLIDAQVPAIALAQATGYAYPIVCNALNHGTLPVRRDFKGDVELFLTQRKINSKGIWTETAIPAQMKHQILAENEPTDLENEMLTQATLKHFKLFRNPFINDVSEPADVYLNNDIRYVLRSMEHEASHQGILAIVGDSGAGKSVLRRLLLANLAKSDDVTAIVPRIIDKTRITAAGLCDAIVADMSEEPAKRSMEAKARQVERLLRESARSGQRHVLIIEEAHDLSIPVLKYLKRLWEMEDGFNKLLGIVLVGQTELKYRLIEHRNPQLREFIRRCLVIEMEPIGNDLEGYLKHKFSRAGADIKGVLDPSAYAALVNKLTRNERQEHPTCLAYHCLIVRCMNLAAELGEAVVTKELIKEA